MTSTFAPDLELGLQVGYTESMSAPHTNLTWNPRVHTNGPRKRGALVGTLLGVKVDGLSIGRGVAYQFAMTTGEVRTVWWDGTVGDDGDGVQYPYLYDIDTNERVLRNPQAMAWFARLEDVSA